MRVLGTVAASVLAPGLTVLACGPASPRTTTTPVVLDGVGSAPIASSPPAAGAGSSAPSATASGRSVSSSAPAAPVASASGATAPLPAPVTSASAPPVEIPHKGPPAWPAKAALKMSAYQPMYDLPAGAGAAALLAVRERSYGMSAFWPSALGEGGITGYRLTKDGRVVAMLDSTKRDWSAIIERPEGRYAIQARDAAGRWTPPLVDTWTLTAQEMHRQALSPSASGILSSGPRPEL